jgi:hypothetical protein
MNASVEPPSMGGGQKNGQKRRRNQRVESVQDEHHEGRNWAVILILAAIILSWGIGLLFLIWSVFG